MEWVDGQCGSLLERLSAVGVLIFADDGDFGGEHVHRENGISHPATMTPFAVTGA